MSIEIPKKKLPDCTVGEVLEMKVVGEKGDNFVLDPYEKEEPKPKSKKKAVAGRARAVTAALSDDVGDHEYR